jgi:hypothetical protein
MKRSTLIFIVLISALFATPFLVVAYYYIFPSEPVIVVMRSYRTISIENPSLDVKDVVIETQSEDNESQKAGDEWIRSLSKKAYHAIYYKGKKTYLPSIREEDGTLYVGKPVEATDDSPLTLHLPSKDVEKIYLNDQEIWSR